MNIIQDGITIIIKSAITGCRLELPVGFVFESEEVQKLISKHSVFTMAYEGAIKCGISKDIPLMKQLMLMILD